MIRKPKALIGPRRFQWNLGGWFGASIGGSAWMFVTTCYLVAHNSPIVALVPASGFLLVTAVSLGLWYRRDRIYPFPALLVLLALLTLLVPVVLTIVSSAAPAEALKAMHWPQSRLAMIAPSGVAPGILVWFLFLEFGPSSAPRSH